MKTFNKLRNFSLTCQLEIWNNLGLSDALWDWMYRIRYTCARFGTVPDPVICPDCIPPRVMTSSAVGLKLEIVGFLPTTHAKTHTKQMRPWSLRTVQPFTHVYLHTQTAVDAGDIHTWQTTVIFITGKSRRPRIWAPCRNKDGAGSGISGVYL